MIKVMILIAVIASSLVLSAENIESLDKECNDGNFQKCTTLGILYAKGEVVEKNFFKSFEYYTKACDSGNLDGCANLGYLYLMGKGTKQDFKKARELYSKTCNSEKKLGCANLGFFYSQGKGVNQDHEKAVSFYDRACTADDVIGCHNLADKYREGKGVKQDLAMALKLYKKSCDGNYSASCHNLAMAHHIGVGTLDINTQKALTFYKKSCTLGFKQSCVSYEILKQKPKVTCETLDQLGWYYVGASFHQRCAAFGVDVNIEQVKNSFLAKNKKFPKKRESFINSCKVKCQDNKECIEKESSAVQEMGNSMAKQRLQDKAGCVDLNGFLNSLK